MDQAQRLDGRASVESARAELIVEAIDDVRQRARRYVQEPADGAWRDLVEALARACGDSGAYDLLRAAAIHARVGSGGTPGAAHKPSMSPVQVATLVFVLIVLGAGAALLLLGTLL